MFVNLQNHIVYCYHFSGGRFPHSLLINRHILTLHGIKYYGCHKISRSHDGIKTIKGTNWNHIIC